MAKTRKCTEGLPAPMMDILRRLGGNLAVARKRRRMRQKDAAFNVSDGDIDPATRLVYEYEKTVTVYYSQTSRYYHSSQDCQQMYDDKYVHSLFEALHQDGKNPCPVCDPFNEADVRERFANK